MNRGNPTEEKKEAETVDRVLGHICLFHLPLDGSEYGGEGPEVIIGASIIGKENSDSTHKCYKSE